jgi:uncharacterized protein (TIGR00159 family)
MIPLFISMRILDVIDIFFVAFLLYQTFRLIKGTVAINILAGIFSVYLFWLIVRAFNMQLISSILGQVMAVGVIALIIVFQQEIRRFLLLLGTRYRGTRGFFTDRLFQIGPQAQSRVDIKEIVEATSHLSKSKTGALIVIARNSELREIIETGDLLNAEVSSRLLESLFFKNSPMHDGAVIIVGERIMAARCILPTTENIYLPAHFGMRHRAALGMVENTDALVILVSEETGKISLASHSEIQNDINPGDLETLMVKELSSNVITSEPVTTTEPL